MARNIGFIDTTEEAEEQVSDMIHKINNKVREKIKVVEENSETLSFQSQLLNFYSITTCFIKTGHRWRPNFICDINKHSNYDEITNVIQKATLLNIGLLV